VSVAVAAAVVTIGEGSITFTALQPVGDGTAGISMHVAISNLRASSAANPTVLDTADIVIAYGTAVETYRKVLIGNLEIALSGSTLVHGQLSSTPPTEYATTASPFSVSVDYGTAPPQAGWSIVNPGDFAQVFADFAPLDKVPIFNLLAIPGIADYGVASEAVAYCERKRAFLIMDTPSPQTAGWGANSVVQGISSQSLSLSAEFPVSINAALYYPWLVTTNQVANAPSTAPPSGFVAGMYGLQDSTRGVWKSPAGIETTLLGTAGVDPSGGMTDAQQGILNENALDCLRQFPGIGTVIFGARTTAGADANTAQQQWKYVAVRRMALFIEQSLYANLT
jgi:uncharacterized protein